MAIRAGAAAGDPNIIWQWDGTLGQFTNGATPEVDAAGAGVLSVVTSFRGHPALRMTAGGVGQSSWAVSLSALSVTMPARYTIVYEIEEMDDGVGGKAPGSQMGPSLFCQFNGAGDILAYTAATFGNVGNFRQMWTRNTTFGLAGGTPGWARPGTTSRRGVIHEVDIEMLLGTPFDMWMLSNLRLSNTRTELWHDDVSTLDFDAGRFDAETPNTIGLGGNFTAASHFCDFTRLMVLKHPADRT